MRGRSTLNPSLQQVRCLVFLGLVLFVLPPLAVATPITIGGTNQANVFPFGTAQYVGEYQQIYISSAFSGPVLIDQIAFQTATFTSGSFSDTFTLGLGTTSATPSAPGSSYAGN